MPTTLSSLFIACSLLGCAADSREEGELPETIVEGAADSWGSPTNFGRLFERVWQFGEIDPGANVKHPAWSFNLDGNANIEIATRVAPTDDPELTATVVYLYKQREGGTWQRIAKTDAGTGFAKLTKSLTEGTYRVIVKGVASNDAGQFLMRMECDGAGCADDEQCLVGEMFHDSVDVKYGAIIDYGSKVLNASSEMTATTKAQIIAAVKESVSPQITTLAQAFDAVDDAEVHRFRFWDNLVGRSLFAIEFGAGDNSFGAFFIDGSSTVSAAIHDGDIARCALPPKACVFGEEMGQAAFMPDMKQTRDRSFTSPAGIDATLAKQIIATVQYDTPITLAEAFENVDEGTIYVEDLEHTDGREFVVVHYYGGDNPVGAYFRKGSDTPVASIGDGEIGGCSEF